MYVSREKEKKGRGGLGRFWAVFFLILGGVFLGGFFFGYMYENEMKRNEKGVQKEAVRRIVYNPEFTQFPQSQSDKHRSGSPSPPSRDG